MFKLLLLITLFVTRAAGCPFIAAKFLAKLNFPMRRTDRFWQGLTGTLNNGINQKCNEITTTEIKPIIQHDVPGTFFSLLRLITTVTKGVFGFEVLCGFVFKK